MGRPREYEPDRVNTQVRLPRKLHEMVRKEAEKREVSVNRIIIWCIERALTEKYRRRNR